MLRRIPLLAILVLSAACRPDAPATPRHDTVPVVLVTIDTLRADALGVYGAVPSPSPTIDRLASSSVVFDHATSPLPETRPSHASIFTSQHPREHGVVSNVFPLPPDLPTMTETLREAGYETAGFTGCALLGPEAGVTRGFDVFDAPGTPQRAADDVVPKALAWLEQTRAPFFLWLHLFDPHMPYEPPVVAGDPPPTTAEAAWPTFAWPDLLAAADRNGGNLPAPLLARAKALYASEVMHVDRWLERLIDGVGRTVDLDRVLLVIAADHGECFGNGTFFDHSNCLYEGATRVPLIVRYPRGLTPARVTTPASLVDLAPTILTLAGLPRPASFRGRDLFSNLEPRPVFFQHPLYRHFDVVERSKVLERLRAVGGEATRPIRTDHEWVGARDETWKYLVSADGEELYRLTDDPHETRNLVEEFPDIAARYRRLVRRWRQEHPLRLLDPDQIEPALLDNLRALGYV